MLAIRRHPRPVVAAVHGRALGGGAGIATACDLILAAESALGYPEVKIGFGRRSRSAAAALEARSVCSNCLSVASRSRRRRQNPSA